MISGYQYGGLCIAAAIIFLFIVIPILIGALH